MIHDNNLIPDEDLLLYHYGDGLELAQRERIAAALKRDPALSQRLRQLLSDLEAVTSQARMNASSAAKARWQASLQAAATAATAPVVRVRSGERRWNWNAALAFSMVLALGIAIGVHWQKPDIQMEPAPLATKTRADTLERGLRLHFARTEQALQQLQSADASVRGALLNDVIEQNRMFALAAERANDDRLARVLRSFDSLLLAMADEALDPAVLQEKSERLDFELSVMQTKLTKATSKTTLQL